ncbi:MAG: lipopolysaccharide heptosyltransferase II [Bacteroidetes bacterium]|nr:lipopolysaccharide heptosyltransferase II [Bacteroidota bacterium]MCW5897395.1 lipopolysaccharide heptosyltransferase II [Bacteroidota bacterium]
MQTPGRILVVQTAFTGDVVLTLPLIQHLHETLNGVFIDVVAVPAAAQVLRGHPAINKIIEYDKKGRQKGPAAAYSLVRHLQESQYGVAIVPHRSIRSAAICYFAGIPRRIGFSTSSGRFLFTDIVPYQKEAHEVLRNLSLAEPLDVYPNDDLLPRLYPSDDDKRAVEALLGLKPSARDSSIVAIAPGSVWATKRWLPERYAELTGRLIREGLFVVLIGGEEDLSVGNMILSGVQSDRVLNAMGKLTLLQSAEMIGRCKIAVTNDSSPMHFAVAMRTPVVAIFGATVPEFGFAPIGSRDEIVQTSGLDCRPCAIHGGNSCPVKTFVCMKNITVEAVLGKVHTVLSKTGVEVA